MKELKILFTKGTMTNIARVILQHVLTRKMPIFYLPTGDITKSRTIEKRKWPCRREGGSGGVLVINLLFVILICSALAV
jgi:hypothetical protein